MTHVFLPRAAPDPGKPTYEGRVIRHEITNHQLGEVGVTMMTKPGFPTRIKAYMWARQEAVRLRRA